MAIKNVFLATVGMSPQVVTETLYAIAKEGLNWPHEINIITTTVGAKKIKEGLIDDQQLARLCEEVDQPIPLFTEAEILIVPNAEGVPVDDARTIEDHQALGDYILTVVQQITAQENVHLHASLAGGRKTMTFYMGYAMSLFGRSQDILSHVLISDGYEGNPHFWFPTSNPDYKIVKTQKDDELDASLAKVDLVSIPFVLHRHELPTLFQTGSHSVQFNDLVHLMNLADRPEDIILELHRKEQKIYLKDLKDDSEAVIREFTPKALDFAYYLIMAQSSLGQINPRLVKRPNTTEEGEQLMRLMLASLLNLIEANTGQSFADLDLQKNKELAMEYIEDYFNAKIRSDALEIFEHETELKGGWFDDRKTVLTRMFTRQLPKKLAQVIVPKTIVDELGDALDQGEGVRNGGYGIHLIDYQKQIRVI